jgi:hypothetical protein
LRASIADAKLSTAWFAKRLVPLKYDALMIQPITNTSGALTVKTSQVLPQWRRRLLKEFS